jgi:hypothetical protein
VHVKRGIIRKKKQATPKVPSQPIVSQRKREREKELQETR